jgi:N-acyl-D-aspartate/D-glutamate deacylase
MPTPLTLQFDLHNPAISFSNMPCWKPLFGADVETQIAIYRDPAFRAAYRKDLVAWGLKWPWDRTEILSAESPAVAALAGKSMQQIANERKQDPIDAFLDIGIADQLRTRFAVPLFNINIDRVGKLIADPRTMLGLSDAGAHIDVFCTADYTTHLLGTWVREHRVLTLERAVQRITSEPAAFFGISDRGRIAKGLAADLVVFDPNTVGSEQRPEMVHDFPDGVGRLVVRSRGIHYTIVNGQVLYEPGQTTSTLRPGKVVRSTPNRPQL